MGVYSVVDAEYRQGGVDLYLKTKWGGVKFWEDAAGNLRPEYSQLQPKYQYPLRLFNSAVGWHTSTRIFGGHPEWEVRGVANFSLIPNAHRSMRAFVKVPKYTGGAVPDATNFANQFAIGADYVFGEDGPSVYP